MNSNQLNRNQGERYTTATERDPLLLSPQPRYSDTSNIRERRPRTTSQSPTLHDQDYYSIQEIEKRKSIDRNMDHAERRTAPYSELQVSGRVPPPYDDEPNASYEMYNENDNRNRPIRSLRSIRSARSQREATRVSRTFSDGRRGERLHQYYNERARRIFSEPSTDEPLVEVSSEIMAVRKSALAVYEPLTYTWVSLI